MWQKLILIFLIIATLCSAASQSKKTLQKDSEVSIPNFGVTSFDYDYSADGKSVVAESKSSQTRATTERPLTRYWNDLIRRLRLSIPWNRGNPLTNLLNRGASHLIETPPISNWKPSQNSNNHNNSNRTSVKTSEKQQQTKQQQQRLVTTYSSNVQTLPPPQGDIYFYDPYAQQYYVVVDLVENPSIGQQQHPTESVPSESKKKEKKTKKNVQMNHSDDGVSVVEQFEDDEIWRKLRLEEKNRHE